MEKSRLMPACMNTVPSRFRRIRLCPQPLAVLAIASEGGAIAGFAAEGGEHVRGHIARVAQHVHDLVITEKYMNFSAGRSRLLLQRHQEVQCFAYSGAAIGDVSCLNEDRTGRRSIAAEHQSSLPP